MTNNIWYPIVSGIGIVLAGIVVYYSSQVSIAAELGDRPTRAEMKATVQAYHFAVQRELDTIKETLKETREDMRAIRRYMEQAIRPLSGIVDRMMPRRDE